jgi:hypothetical protein
MVRGTFVVEDRVRERKETLGKEVTWERVILRGIDALEVEKRSKGFCRAAIGTGAAGGSNE